MASDTSRKRKHGEGTASSLSQPRIPENAIRGACDSGHGIIERDRKSRQSFMNSSVQDHARAHFGNVYYVTNVEPETTAEDSKYQAFIKALAFKRMDFRQAAIDPAYAGTCQ